MKMIGGLGITGALAHHVFADGQAAIAATPNKGGVVRFASNSHGPNDTLDPNLFTSSLDYTRARATYNGLVQITEGLVATPELAESFTPNADATEWTFKLRKGVTFHDGSPLTPEDVVYSMNRHLGEASTSKLKPIMTSVKGWRKTGPNEVKAEMHTANSDLPATLGIYQAKIIKADSNGGGIGTGPFVLEQFQPGIRSVHLRNNNYWREAANLDAIEMTAITDPVARVNAVVAGDIQLAALIDPNSFRQVEESSTARLLTLPASQQISICVLKSTAPGSNADFVKGMQYIQDRERVVNRLLKGKGTLGNDHPISAAHGADFCSDLAQRQYDPDKAAYHFKKSGVSSAQIYVAPVAVGIEDIVALTQANCAKIGFDLKINKVPSDGYWGAVWLKEPLAVTNWNMRPTANAQMALQFAPGAPWNDSHWNNGRMGELLKMSLAELNPENRHAMYCEMQTLIHENSGIVTPAFSNTNDAIANNVMGVPKVPLGPVGGCEWPEFVWLA